MPPLDNGTFMEGTDTLRNAIDRLTEELHELGKHVAAIIGELASLHITIDRLRPQ